ncbi:hypothetical protein E8E14_008522 [Neopestalotiopsis sp. 37M]|nr:hypothetical protein E8E14_008522 [Neopestalotiopsis sp. 37M]
MAPLITRSPAWTGLSPYGSSALDAVDATTKTHDVLIDLSTNDIMLDLSADDQLQEKKLRQEVVSHDAKLEAVKQDLNVAEKQYYEASNNWNAALEEPSPTAKEMNDLWDERENKLKRVQQLKLLLKKRQEEADMAKVAMRNFENKMI